MIRILRVSIFLWLLASAAGAQTVLVRSGEHGDFTRLVLDLPTGVEITAAPLADGGGTLLKLPGPGYRLDTSQVFDRITRTRIASVTALPDGAGLDIRFGCACGTRLFRAGDRMMVLDVGESLPKAQDVVPSDGNSAPETGMLSEVRLGADPGIGPRQVENPLMPAPFFQDRIRAEEDTRMLTDLTEFEQSLAQQVASAATQGLLETVLDPRLLAQPPSPSKPPAALPQKAREHVGASLVPSQPSDPEQRIRLGGQIPCTADSALDLSAWGGEADTPLDGHIPALRSRLYDGRDRLDREVMHDLVRAYLSIGFGVEARALLALDEERPPELLAALALIVDGKQGDLGVFDGQTECDGAAALWSVLAGGEGADRVEINDAAVLRAFEALPLVLRDLLGPQLATRLAQAGHEDTARNVLSRLQRATGSVSQEMQFTGARIDLLSGEIDAAKSVLDSFTHENGPRTAEAVTAAIEVATQQGAPVPARLTDLSAAYLTELRKTEQGPDIWLAHVRSLWANGQFQEAVTELLQTDEIPDATLAKAASEVVQAMAEKAETPLFLRHVLDPHVFALPGLDGDVSLDVASRLLDLNLPDSADQWLGRYAAEPEDRRKALLLARRHLAGGEPEAAEIALIGLQGEDVLALRVQAREMMQDFTFAADAFARLGRSDEAQDAAWLAGDWAALENGAEPTYAATADLVRSELPDLEAAPITLALGETLAASGAETLQTLRSLLEETRLQD